MSRADLMLSVLQDGQPHSRRDIQSRVGYFLTNNAASELRKRGLNVVYENRAYQLILPSLRAPATAGSVSAGALSEVGSHDASQAHAPASLSSPKQGESVGDLAVSGTGLLIGPAEPEPISPDQLSLEGVAA